MSLRGNLNSVDLANIFQMLSINQKEGTLNIFDGDSRKSIYFSRDGVSMLSRGRAKKDTLGQILLRYDRISEEQLDRALETHRHSNKLLGTILQEAGLVEPGVIEDALRIQIEEEIYNLFVWKDASFEFIEGSPPPELDRQAGVQRLTFNVNSLIMEAARRIDEWEQIQRIVPSMNEIYRYSGRNMELTDDIFREAYCEKVLAAINGKCTIEEIIERSFVNKFEVCRILSLLLDQSAIEPVPPSDLVTLAETANSRGQAMEAVKFLERIVELRADTSEVHQSLGEAFESMKEIRKASNHYRIHAEASIDAGEPEQAFTIYKKICELLPTDLRSAERLIEIYVEHASDISGDTTEVIEKGRTLASIFYELRLMNPAVATLHRVIALAPEDASLRHLLINIYLANNMSSEAIDEYEVMATQYTKKRDVDQVLKILRKILVIDRNREDVGHRLQALLLKKEKKKRGVKRLLVTIVIVVGMSVLAYGYITYELEARENIATQESAASKVIDEQNERVKPALAALQALKPHLTDGSVDTDDLVAACRRVAGMRDGYQQEIQSAIDSLAEVGGRYRFTTANKHANERQDDLRRMIREFDAAIAWAQAEIQRRALEMVVKGKSLEQAGKFSLADQLYRKAWDIAPDQEPLRTAEVDRRLADFQKSFNEINEVLGRIRGLIDDGEHTSARRSSLDLMKRYPFAEVVARIPVPVQIETLPKGAEIFMNGVSTGKRTPDWILWNATETSEVTLKLRGFDDARKQLRAVNPERITTDLRRVEDLKDIRWEFHKETIWESTVSGAVEAEPTRVGDSIYIATRNSLVYRIDIATRKQTLLFDAQGESLSGSASSPLLHDEHMFLAMVEGKILRVAWKTGEVTWSKRISGRIYAPLTLSGQMLFVGDISGNISAWDAPSGELLWQHPLSGEIRSRPVVAGGKVFVTTSTGHLYAYTLSGELVFDMVPGGEGRIQLGTPLVRGDRLYVCSADGRLHALDLATRKEVWTYRVPAEVRSDPVLQGDTFFLGALDGYVYAIREGKLLARHEIGGSVLCAPAVDGTRVVVLNDTGRIVRSEFRDGKFTTHWRYELDKKDLRMLVPPILIGDRLLIVPESGRLFLLRD